jgi:hypothetical protein
VPKIGGFIGAGLDWVMGEVVMASLRLEFEDICLQVEVRDRAKTAVDADVDGHPSAWPADFFCQDLLLDIDELTRKVGAAIESFNADLDRFITAGHHAEAAWCHWTIARMWFATGHDKWAVEAVNVGARLLTGEYGHVEVDDELSRLGEDLVARLTELDRPKVIARVQALLRPDQQG